MAAPAGFRSPLFVLGLSISTVTPTGPTVQDGFLYTKAESQDFGVDWRAPLTQLIVFAASAVVAPHPSAVAELLSSGSRMQALLDGMRRIRLLAAVTSAGPTAAAIGAQYSLDGGSTWAWLDGTAAATTTGTPKTVVDATGMQASAWATPEAAACADVLLRLVACDGDDLSATGLGNMFLEVSSR